MKPSRWALAIERIQYMGVRYKQIIDPDVLRERPYWIYDAVNDRRTSQLHAVWDLLVLPATDQWWQTHLPPNGLYCRCSVRSARREDLDRLGLTVSQRPDNGVYLWTDKISGQVSTIPRGVSPGWQHSPSDQGAWERLVLRLKQTEREVTNYHG